MKHYLKEFFLFPDVTVMFVIYLCLIGYVVPFMSQLSMWISLIIGMITYALSEYLVHRFLFHMKTPKSPFLLKIIKRLHFDHHVDPRNLKLLFLPIWFSIPNFSILGGIFYLITNNFPLTMAFIVGLITYFLYYEWTHYVAHRPIKPLTKIGDTIKKAHLWHHYKNENYWFGVTHMTVDKTLGTYKNHEEVETSETARNLEKRM
ncbi:sterol desaturase family protein [Bacillus andreraoultii]|uniref:sterol desaturase family protein n=1 Tax=Bacillus andreraoultii TaxID=1499685 RepID=UPI000539A025|nr:sterol desaturase family protein [Bacillus andreraoultii]